MDSHGPGDKDLPVVTMTLLPTESELRQRRFEFNPWFFSAESLPAEKEAQLQYHALLHRLYGVKIGAECFVATTASITGSPGGALQMGRGGFVAAGAYITDEVVLGDNCTVNPYATIRGKFRCGDGVRIGAYACIVGFNHGFERIDIPICEQPHTSRGIVLGDDIWVGAQVTIVDGVTVGSHAILAGGAVVTRDVPDYAIVGGNPAKVIRMRDAAQKGK
jgi:acetyltransferase-like isoleucine patch superfamily enzyme